MITISYRCQRSMLKTDIAAPPHRSGEPIGQFDAMIASTVRSRSARLATRNTADFDGCEITLLTPWKR
jgi:predicted nucleic acid-binding protein